MKRVFLIIAFLLVAIYAYGLITKPKPHGKISLKDLFPDLKFLPKPNIRKRK